MSHNANDYQQINESYQQKKCSSLRKTILRNPELPLKDKYQNSSAQQHNKTEEFEERNRTQQQIDSRIYHKPRLNKIKEMKEKLESIKLWKANEIMEGSTDNTKVIAFRTKK